MKNVLIYSVFLKLYCLTPKKNPQKNIQTYCCVMDNNGDFLHE